MAGDYSTSTKAARMTAVRDQIDADVSPGRIEIGTAGMSTILASFDLNAVSGTVTGPTLTFSGFPKTVAVAASGTPAEAQIVDGAGGAVRSGMSVGLSGSGADVILDSLSLTAGQNSTLNSASITHS